MMKIFFLPVVLLLMTLNLMVAPQAQAESELRVRQYRGFTLWLDCETRHGAVAFYYELGRDKGDFSNSGGGFGFDQKLPARCQPQSWRSYDTTTVPSGSGKWLRALLVPPNHLDHNRAAQKETHLLSNTLPQAAGFGGKEGAWLHSERISECYREISGLKIWGGVIWGKDTENDYFTATHGIATPDAWWKVIYRTDKNEYIAWHFPNDSSALASKMASFRISAEALLKRGAFVSGMPDIASLISGAKSSADEWPLTITGTQLTCEGKSTSLQ